MLKRNRRTNHLLCSEMAKDVTPKMKRYNALCIGIFIVKWFLIILGLILCGVALHEMAANATRGLF